jgi:hypothetical protein
LRLRNAAEESKIIPVLGYYSYPPVFRGIFYCLNQRINPETQKQCLYLLCKFLQQIKQYNADLFASPTLTLNSFTKYFTGTMKHSSKLFLFPSSFYFCLITGRIFPKQKSTE